MRRNWIVLIAILIVSFGVIIYLWLIKPQIELTQALNSVPHYQGIPKNLKPGFNLWGNSYRWKGEITYRINEPDSQKILDYYHTVLIQKGWKFDEELGTAFSKAHVYSNDRYWLIISVEKAWMSDQPPNTTAVDFGMSFKKL